MTNNYSEEAASVANAINAVYENKVTNKKDNISGDFSSDAVSYPTVRGVKNHFGEKVTDWSNTPVDTNYPSEKLVKDTIDDLESDLSDDLTVTIEKQATAESGYASTYVVKQGGTALSPKINIPKDQMVRSASVVTVGATPTSEETAAGLSTGDRYILLVVNTVDNDNATDLIIPITDFFDLQSADGVTLELSNAGVYSIKASGVDTAQLKDSSVTYAKLNSATITTLESSMDTKISDFASALASAINPSS